MAMGSACRRLLKLQVVTVREGERGSKRERERERERERQREGGGRRERGSVV